MPFSGEGKWHHIKLLQWLGGIYHVFAQCWPGIWASICRVRPDPGWYPRPLKVGYVRVRAPVKFHAKISRTSFNLLCTEISMNVGFSDRLKPCNYPLIIHTCCSDLTYIHLDTSLINPKSDGLSYFNFHPLEVVSRYRDPQLQVGKYYLYLSNLNLNKCQFRKIKQNYANCSYKFIFSKDK